MTREKPRSAIAPLIQTTAPMHRWKLSVLATAAALSAGLYATNASALALGPVNVQSTLGQPLRAEIPLPQITPAEADSLRVIPASPAVVRAQGLEYSSAAHDVQIELHRNPDGTMALWLRGNGPVNDPFVDLVIDASWSSGHIVRSYTLLIDPPARPPQPQAPVTAAAAPRQAQPPAPAESHPVTPPPPATTPRPVAQQTPPSQSEGQSAGAGGEVTVHPGDTAGRIANANKPASVSLDQMLLAMLRANPNAFIKGNVNRMRAGVVLQMPSEADAQATPVAEARKQIVAQSRDFNKYRNQLASTAQPADVTAPSRKSSGTVGSQVEEQKPTAASPDKLIVGGAAGNAKEQKADTQLAIDKQKSQNTARIAELDKNKEDLAKIRDQIKTTGASGATTPAPNTGAAVTVPTPPGVPSTPPPAPTPPPTPAPTPTPTPEPPNADTPANNTVTPPAPAPEPVKPAPAPRPAPRPAPPPPPPEPGLLDTLTDNPLWTGIGVLVLALLGFGGYRFWKSRREPSDAESSFVESNMQGDSFFGASGGQRVDTTNSELSSGASSSLAYSPSQLDAGGDVDPVAEADVYLAYGRDLQAEEILKEAARHHPERASIPVKLAEIYAKRQDRKALEAIASQVFALTNGQGADWARVAELGRALEPGNALYQPGGRPGAAPAAAAPAAAAPVASTPAARVSPPPLAAASAPAPEPADLDLDLDLDLHEAPPAPQPPAPAPAPAPARAFTATAAAGASAVAAATGAALHAPAAPVLNLDSAPPANIPQEQAATILMPMASAPAPLLSADTDRMPPPEFKQTTDMSLVNSGLAALGGNSAKPSAPVAKEFDLGDLSLELTEPTTAAPSPVSAGKPAAAPTAKAAEPLPTDPLATKLALAQEFSAIGDNDGARSLIEEVIAAASGELKTRAQHLLAELG